MLIPLLSTLACLLGIVLITILHNQHRNEVVVHPTGAPADAPFISVIVPARNEARNIRRCVEGLLRQDYPHYELVVVDDRSTDATAGILQELAASTSRLRVIHGSELPPGWTGKTHALWQGAQAARGAWLCFVDADTFASPALLSSTLQAAVERQADLFSIFTRQELGSFWEKVVLPLVFTALTVGFAPRRVNDPGDSAAIANGQFILVRRPVYQAVGGHAAIKGSIVEDRDLAQLVKGRGFRLLVADGRALASTRMYTDLAEMWEGWTKNIFLGLRDQTGLLLLGVFGAFAMLFAALLLPLWLLGGILWWAGAGGIPALVVTLEAALVWITLLFWRALACRGMGIPGLYALTVPLGSAVFAAMMIVSAWKVLSRRGVTWKGRVYRRGG